MYNIKTQNSKRYKGYIQEKKALSLLCCKSIIPIFMNFREKNICEADIIATKDNTLICAEVKSCDSKNYKEFLIEKKINKDKIRKLKNITKMFQTKLCLPFTSVRIDIIYITTDKIYHYINV